MYSTSYAKSGNFFSKLVALPLAIAFIFPSKCFSLKESFKSKFLSFKLYFPVIRLLSKLIPLILTILFLILAFPVIFIKSPLGRVITVLPKSTVPWRFFTSPSTLAFKFSKTNSALSKATSLFVILFTERLALTFWFLTS